MKSKKQEPYSPSINTCFNDKEHQLTDSMFLNILQIPANFEQQRHTKVFFFFYFAMEFQIDGLFSRGFS